MFRKLRRKIVRLALVSGAGAAATYFFDRERGVERREQAKAKATSLLNRQGGGTVTDWESNLANGFDSAPPVTATSTPTASVTDITGTIPTTTPVDVLIAEPGAATGR